MCIWNFSEEPFKSILKESSKLCLHHLYHAQETKIACMQASVGPDHESRRLFASRHTASPHWGGWGNRVCFSDEAMFCMCRTISRHSCFVWGIKILIKLLNMSMNITLMCVMQGMVRILRFADQIRRGLHFENVSLLQCTEREKMYAINLLLFCAIHLYMLHTLLSWGRIADNEMPPKWLFENLY